MTYYDIEINSTKFNEVFLNDEDVKSFRSFMSDDESDILTVSKNNNKLSYQLFSKDIGEIFTAVKYNEDIIDDETNIIGIKLYNFNKFLEIIYTDSSIYFRKQTDIKTTINYSESYNIYNDISSNEPVIDSVNVLVDKNNVVLHINNSTLIVYSINDIDDIVKLHMRSKEDFLKLTSYENRTNTILYSNFENDIYIYDISSNLDSKIDSSNNIISYNINNVTSIITKDEETYILKLLYKDSSSPTSYSYNLDGIDIGDNITGLVVYDNFKGNQIDLFLINVQNAVNNITYFYYFNKTEKTFKLSTQIKKKYIEGSKQQKVFVNDDTLLFVSFFGETFNFEVIDFFIIKQTPVSIIGTVEIDEIKTITFSLDSNTLNTVSSLFNDEIEILFKSQAEKSIEVLNNIFEEGYSDITINFDINYDDELRLEVYSTSNKFVNVIQSTGNTHFPSEVTIIVNYNKIISIMSDNYYLFNKSGDEKTEKLSLLIIREVMIQCGLQLKNENYGWGKYLSTDRQFYIGPEDSKTISEFNNLFDLTVNRLPVEPSLLYSFSDYSFWYKGFIDSTYSPINYKDSTPYPILSNDILNISINDKTYISSITMGALEDYGYKMNYDSSYCFNNKTDISNILISNYNEITRTFTMNNFIDVNKDNSLNEISLFVEFSKTKIRDFNNLFFKEVTDISYDIPYGDNSPTIEFVDKNCVLRFYNDIPIPKKIYFKACFSDVLNNNIIINYNIDVKVNSDILLKSGNDEIILLNNINPTESTPIKIQNIQFESLSDIKDVSYSLDLFFNFVGDIPDVLPSNIIEDVDINTYFDIIEDASYEYNIFIKKQTYGAENIQINTFVLTFTFLTEFKTSEYNFNINLYDPSIKINATDNIVEFWNLENLSLRDYTFENTKIYNITLKNTTTGPLNGTPLLVDIPDTYFYNKYLIGPGCIIKDHDFEDFEQFIINKEIKGTVFKNVIFGDSTQQVFDEFTFNDCSFIDCLFNNIYFSDASFVNNSFINTIFEKSALLNIEFKNNIFTNTTIRNCKTYNIYIDNFDNEKIKLSNTILKTNIEMDIDVSNGVISAPLTELYYENYIVTDEDMLYCFKNLFGITTQKFIDFNKIVSNEFTIEDINISITFDEFRLNLLKINIDDNGNQVQIINEQKMWIICDKENFIEIEDLSENLTIAEQMDELSFVEELNTLKHINKFIFINKNNCLFISQQNVNTEMYNLDNETRTNYIIYLWNSTIEVPSLETQKASIKTLLTEKETELGIGENEYINFNDILFIDTNEATEDEDSKQYLEYINNGTLIYNVTDLSLSFYYSINKNSDELKITLNTYPQDKDKNIVYGFINALIENVKDISYNYLCIQGNEHIPNYILNSIYTDCIKYYKNINDISNNSNGFLPNSIYIDYTDISFSIDNYHISQRIVNKNKIFDVKNNDTGLITNLKYGDELKLNTIKVIVSFNSLYIIPNINLDSFAMLEETGKITHTYTINSKEYSITYDTVNEILEHNTFFTDIDGRIFKDININSKIKLLRNIIDNFNIDLSFIKIDSSLKNNLYNSLLKTNETYFEDLSLNECSFYINLKNITLNDYDMKPNEVFISIYDNFNISGIARNGVLQKFNSKNFIVSSIDIYKPRNYNVNVDRTNEISTIVEQNIADNSIISKDIYTNSFIELELLNIDSVKIIENIFVYKNNSYFLIDDASLNDFDSNNILFLYVNDKTITVHFNYIETGSYSIKIKTTTTDVTLNEFNFNNNDVDKLVYILNDLPIEYDTSYNFELYYQGEFIEQIEFQTYNYDISLNSSKNSIDISINSVKDLTSDLSVYSKLKSFDKLTISNEIMEENNNIKLDLNYNLSQSDIIIISRIGNKVINVKEIEYKFNKSEQIFDVSQNQFYTNELSINIENSNYKELYLLIEYNDISNTILLQTDDFGDYNNIFTINSSEYLNNVLINVELKNNNGDILLDTNFKIFNYVSITNNLIDISLNGYEGKKLLCIVEYEDLSWNNIFIDGTLKFSVRNDEIVKLTIVELSGKEIFKKQFIITLVNVYEKTVIKNNEKTISLQLSFEDLNELLYIKSKKNDIIIDILNCYSSFNYAFLEFQLTDIETDKLEIYNEKMELLYDFTLPLKDNNVYSFTFETIDNYLKITPNNYIYSQSLFSYTLDTSNITLVDFELTNEPIVFPNFSPENTYKLILYHHDNNNVEKLTVDTTDILLYNNKDDITVNLDVCYNIIDIDMTFLYPLQSDITYSIDNITGSIDANLLSNISEKLIFNLGDGEYIISFYIDNFLIYDKNVLITKPEISYSNAVEVSNNSIIVNTTSSHLEPNNYITYLLETTGIKGQILLGSSNFKESIIPLELIDDGSYNFILNDKYGNLLSNNNIFIKLDIKYVSYVVGTNYGYQVNIYSEPKINKIIQYNIIKDDSTVNTGEVIISNGIGNFDVSYTDVTIELFTTDNITGIKTSLRSFNTGNNVDIKTILYDLNISYDEDSFNSLLDSITISSFGDLITIDSIKKLNILSRTNVDQRFINIIRHYIINKIFNNNPSRSIFFLESKTGLLENFTPKSSILITKPNQQFSITSIIGKTFDFYSNLDNINDYTKIKFENSDILTITKNTQYEYGISSERFPEIYNNIYEEGDIFNYIDVVGDLTNSYLILLGGAGITGNTDRELSLDPDISSSDIEISKTTEQKVIMVSIKFDIDVESFTETQINISNGIINEFSSIDNQNFTMEISPINEGEVKIEIPDEAVTYVNGFQNTYSSFSFNYVTDLINQTVTITSDNVENNGFINIEEISLNFILNEESPDFDISDIELSNCTISGFRKTSSFIYKANIKADVEGEVKLIINSNQFTDSVGNFNNTGTTFTYNYDITKPILTLTSDDILPNKYTNKELLTILLSCSKQLQEELVDISSNIIFTNVEFISIEKIDETNVRIIIKRINDGTVNIKIPANSVTDYAGNKNDSIELSFTIDTNKPIIEIIDKHNLITDSTTKFETITLKIISHENISDFNISNSDLNLTNCTIDSIKIIDSSTNEIVIKNNLYEEVKLEIKSGSIIDKANNINDSKTISYSYVEKIIEETDTITSISETIPDNTNLILNSVSTFEFLSFYDEGLTEIDSDIAKIINEFNNTKINTMRIVTNSGETKTIKNNFKMNSLYLNTDDFSTGSFISIVEPTITFMIEKTDTKYKFEIEHKTGIKKLKEIAIDSSKMVIIEIEKDNFIFIKPGSLAIAMLKINTTKIVNVTILLNFKKS